MAGFVKIVTLFEQPEERNLDLLSTVYYDIERLNEIIGRNLGEYYDEKQIQGRKVLLKPNWVRHSVKTSDEICLRTNDNLILAALIFFLEKKPSGVIVGDAPIQGCSWERMVSGSFMEKINSLSARFGIPVSIRDFRRRTYSFSQNEVLTELRPVTDYVIFDLGEKSCLEPVSLPGKTRFRVTNYNPDRMSEAHSPGVHKYCISRDLFDADIVVSLPKIKTHQKTGITGALKNIVGINGDKDFLPHHRIGGEGRGGDCYPGRSVLRYWSELMLDEANRRQGKKSFWLWQKLSSLLWIVSFPTPEHSTAAGWYGNDTTWRMVHDLNQIAMYGKADGTLSDQPQRHMLSICDGVVAGQGDGPLEPEPLPMGLISFTDNPFANDYAMALLMGLSPEKIPLLNNNMPDSITDCNITLNGAPATFHDLKKIAVKARPPKGWALYLK